jgi:hypothetical protein
MERVIGSIRRECLDHVIVIDEGSLRRILAAFFDYYHCSRSHLTLNKDSPEPRPVQPPGIGPVVALPQAGDCTTATSGERPDLVKVRTRFGPL